MDKYEASNGMRVWFPAEAQGALQIQGVFPDPLAIPSPDVDALREFFRAERDEELGRWRWPENPDYVVYPRDEYGQTVVLRESTGHNITFLRGHVNKQGSDHARCALAFFEAHPEPKPWHDAKEGEVWIIQYNGNEYPAIFQAGMFRDHGGSWTADSITAARRIYPAEETS